jgi:hypothetical protein
MPDLPLRWVGHRLGKIRRTNFARDTSSQHPARKAILKIAAVAQPERTVTSGTEFAALSVGV